VEEIACQKDHVDISFLGQAHDFVEGFPAVVASDMVAFVVSNMIVRCDEDTNRVGCCSMSVMFEWTCGNWTLTCCGWHRGVRNFGMSDQQKWCREHGMTRKLPHFLCMSRSTTPPMQTGVRDALLPVKLRL
jgi:hypothetical protein